MEKRNEIPRDVICYDCDFKMYDEQGKYICNRVGHDDELELETGGCEFHENTMQSFLKGLEENECKNCDSCEDTKAYDKEDDKNAFNKFLESLAKDIAKDIIGSKEEDRGKKEAKILMDKATPVIDFLRNLHPDCKVVITAKTVELIQPMFKMEILKEIKIKKQSK